MKEIPILFSTPMVQAILAGRKTMTRRIADVPVHDHFGKDIMDWDLSEHPYLHEGKWKYSIQTDVDDYVHCILKYKYGQPGDILWVRESWRGIPQDFGPDRIEFKASEVIDVRGKWKPSIHMKKEAARIWLKVTDVRVERLQDISEEDAFAEGAEPRSHRCGGTGYYEAGGDIHDCVCLSWNKEPSVLGFMDIWHEINGAESWNNNPWVWVVSFEVLSTTGKPSLPPADLT